MHYDCGCLTYARHFLNVPNQIWSDLFAVYHYGLNGVIHCVTDLSGVTGYRYGSDFHCDYAICWYQLAMVFGFSMPNDLVNHYESDSGCENDLFAMLAYANETQNCAKIRKL